MRAPSQLATLLAVGRAANAATVDPAERCPTSPGLAHSTVKLAEVLVGASGLAIAGIVQEDATVLGGSGRMSLLQAVASVGRSQRLAAWQAQGGRGTLGTATSRIALPLAGAGVGAALRQPAARPSFARHATHGLVALVPSPAAAPAGSVAGAVAALAGLHSLAPPQGHQGSPRKALQIKTVSDSIQPPHEEGLPDRRAVLPRRSTDEERTQLDAVWREEFRRFRTEDAEVRRENALLRKEDIKLRLQNTELRRALVHQTGHPDTVEVGDGGVEEDLEQSVQFTSRTVWAIAIGGGIVLVLCIAFWACEEYIRNAADQDGDGDVDMEDRKIAMRKLRVNATSLLAGFTLTAVVVGVFVILCWTGVLKVMLAQLLMYALLMVCVMGCLGIFMYNIYMNLVNLLGSLFGDLKDMITGVVEYLEEKAEEAAEEVEKVTGTMGFMSQDSPGMYVIKSKCDLQKTEKLDSQILQMLNEGVLVNVMKVRLRLKESRIRGLVESPRGWISLQDLESGFRWADKKEYRKGKFKVIVDSLPVSEGVEVDSPVASKPVVKRGDIVKVSQVRHRIREGAVRGAIDEGWITLLDTKTGIGVRNVQPIETQPTEGLFPFFTGAGESSSAAEVAADTAMLPGDAAMAAEPAAAEEHREPGEEEQEDESRMHDLFTDPFLTKRTAPAA